MKRDFPDCTRCRTAACADKRSDWGCDSPKEIPVFEISCSRCGGQDSACKDCEGTNLVPRFQCPGALFAQAPIEVAQSVALAVRLYVQYDARQVLPVEGGLGDQSPSFVDVIDIIDSERAMWERKRREFDEVMADREKKARERQAALARQRKG